MTIGLTACLLFSRTTKYFVGIQNAGTLPFSLCSSDVGTWTHAARCAGVKESICFWLKPCSAKDPYQAMCCRGTCQFFPCSKSTILVQITNKICAPVRSAWVEYFHSTYKEARKIKDPKLPTVFERHN